MIAAITTELVRLTSWRRWWFLAVPGVAVAWTVADNVSNQAQQGGYRVNAWDVPLEMLNNVVIIVFVLLPLAGLMAGQAATRDRTDGYAALTITRLRSRAAWWTVKIATMVLSVFALIALVMLAALVVGAVVTGRLGATLSQYGSAAPNPMGSAAAAARYYGPPPLLGLPAVLRVLPEYAYTSLAIAALVCLCFLPAARWAKAWLSFVVLLAVALGFFFVTPTTIFHPLVHLTWDQHTFSVSQTAVAWWASGVVIAAELAIALTGGAFLARRSDMIRST